MYRDRPVLLNVVQFRGGLASRALDCAGLLGEANDRGFDGVELRREEWDGYERELDAVRRTAANLDLTVTYATFSELDRTTFDDDPRQLEAFDHEDSTGSWPSAAAGSAQSGTRG